MAITINLTTDNIITSLTTGIIAGGDGDIVGDNFIFQDGNNFIFQDGNNFIYN